MSRCVIREYTKQSLGDLLEDRQFWMQPRLPVTKLRVLSHLANPRADAEDVVLFTVSDRDQVVAYAGILPDRLRDNDHTPTKFGWLSTWWADHRNGAAGTMLLLLAMKRYENRIASTNFSPQARRLFDSTRRFEEFASFPLTYFVLALPPRWPIVSPCSRWMAGVKNRMLFHQRLDHLGLSLEVVVECNEKLDSYLKHWTMAEPITRERADWRWIMHNPWVSTSQEESDVQRRYEFSVFAKDFQQLPVVISHFGVIVGFLFLTLHHGRLLLKYAYYDPSDLKLICVSLKFLITQLNPWAFVSADSNLNLTLRRELPFYVVAINRPAAGYAHKCLSVPRFPHQFGIGDTVFT